MTFSQPATPQNLVDSPWDISAIAYNYQQQGYVIVMPTQSADLPAGLKSYFPDFLAQKNGETVFVLVRPRPQLAQHELRKIAEAIAAQPHWRLDVIVQPPPLSELRTVEVKEIKRRLLQAIKLLKSDYLEAALLLTVSSLEAVLVRLCQQEQIDVNIDGFETRSVLKTLATRGFLNEVEWAIAKQGFDARDEVSRSTPANPGSHNLHFSLTQRLLLLTQKLL